MKGKIAALLWGCVLAFSVSAADKQLRIGTLAPKNSLYHRQLMELGETWRSAQGAGSKYLVYPDGSQGGEADMVRRMRIGQLQGALLSVVGLREIEPSIAALQAMPLMFRSWEEVDYVREKMRPAMEAKFLDKGFVVLAWGDAGWVRFFSKEAALRPDDYKKMKFFAWDTFTPMKFLCRLFDPLTRKTQKNGGVYISMYLLDRSELKRSGHLPG
jgi:TRAP-type transport system periplasmic protein